MDKLSIIQSVGKFFGLRIVRDGGADDELSSSSMPDDTMPGNVACTLTVDILHRYIREAESGDPANIFSLMRDTLFSDSHILTEFGKRKIAVAGDLYKIDPVDKGNQQAVWVANQIEGQVKALGSQWPLLLVHLLDGTIMPVAASMITWRPSSREGWHYELAGFNHVLLTSLDYSDNGRLRIRLKDGSFLVPGEYNTILHRGHVLSNFADYWGGPIRALLFWYLFSAISRDQWVALLSKWGHPFLKGKYDPNDKGSRERMVQAFRRASRMFGVVISKDTDVEVMEIANRSGDAFQAFKTFANAEISKLILGQTMSSTAANVGLGGGQASVQEEVRQDLRQYDAMMLSYTLREGLFVPLCRLNGWPEEYAPEIAFGAISRAEQGAVASILTGIATAGLEPTDEGIESLSDMLGFPLQRKPQASPMAGFPFSATSSASHPRVAPAPGAGVARRARETAALSAIDQIVDKSVESYKAALGEQYKPFRAALEQSTSRADFLRRVSALGIQDNPKAIDKLAEAMTAASANALIAAQPKS